MSEKRFRGVPFALLVNPFRLNTFEQDVDGAILVRKADYLAKKELIASGRGDEGRKYGWRMLINQNNHDLVKVDIMFRHLLDHSVVLFLPTQALLDIQRGFIKGRNVIEKIKSGFREPWA
jgi:hypothetical protein